MKLAIRGGIKAPKGESRASHTPGKTKGGKCVTDPRKKFLLCHPHAHRLDPEGYSKMHTWAKANHGMKG